MNVVVAFAVVIFIVRWATTSSMSVSLLHPICYSVRARGGEPTAEQVAARALRFRPKKVTPEMAWIFIHFSRPHSLSAKFR